MPDVKEALDKNLSKIEGYVGEDRIKIVKDLYAEVEKIGKSDKSIEEKTKAAKDLVQDKLGDSSQFKALGLDKMQDLSSQGKKWLEQATGLTGLTKVHCDASRCTSPGRKANSRLTQVFDEVDIKALKDLAQKRGDDAEKIMHETYAGASPLPCAASGAHADACLSPVRRDQGDPPEAGGQGEEARRGDEGRGQVGGQEVNAAATLAKDTVA